MLTNEARPPGLRKSKSLTTTEAVARVSFKNGMRPVHPGEVLREDFPRPAGLTANALAKALRVPAPRINDIVRERAASRPTPHEASALLRWGRTVLAELADVA